MFGVPVLQNSGDGGYEMGAERKAEMSTGVRPQREPLQGSDHGGNLYMALSSE